jgi:methylated-DNA-[protein]-cysteine S-methyltransferase
MTKLLIDKINSEIGTIFVVSDSASLCALDFADYETRMMQLLQRRYGQFDLAETNNPQGFSDQIQAYLAGNHSSIDQIPVNPGGTVFQQQIWLALRSIPLGTVVSYGELATKLGNPNACRAVGLANSLNPVAIVLPCHRVVGANASLTGYAGGLERKRWLLRHEGVDVTRFDRPKPSGIQHSLFDVQPL